MNTTRHAPGGLLRGTALVLVAGCLLLSKSAEAVALPDESTWYHGIVTHESEAWPYVSGAIHVKLGRAGGFSGWVDAGSKRERFKGQLDGDGWATTSIKYRFKIFYGYIQKARLGMITLRLDEASGMLVGQVDYRNSWGGKVVDFEALPELKGKASSPVAGTGRYPFTLEDGAGSAASGLLDVKPTGKAKLKGRMVDGRKFTTKSALCEGRVIPVFRFLPKPRGILLGWMDVGGEPARVGGQIDWNTTGPLNDPPDPAEAYRVLDVVAAP